MKYLNSRTYLSLNQLCWPHVWRTRQVSLYSCRYSTKDLILSSPTGRQTSWACSISREGVANATKDFNLVQIFFWKHPTQQKCLTSLSRRSTCWHLERPKKKLLLGGDVAVRKQLPFHMSAFSTCPPSGIQATFTRLSFLGWRVDLILSKSLESMC